MSRRKPSLRIGGGVLNRSTLHNPNQQTGLGLLGSYNDTDEAPDGGENGVKSTNNVDSKVADFLKEIDELESETPATEEPPKISWGNWQQCLDQKTQHPYYWNTVTNEVTWILPEDIAKQIKAVQSVNKSEDDSNEEKKLSSNEADKLTSQKKEDFSEKAKRTHEKTRENLDLDVDAELEQALENEADAPIEMTEIDSDLELLRTGKLPLSQHEQETFLESLEDRVLSLEENEENRRKNGTWKDYKQIIDLRHEEVRCDKLKWRMNGLPKLKNLILEKNSREDANKNKDSENAECPSRNKENAKTISQVESGSDMETSLEEKEEKKPDVIVVKKPDVIVRKIPEEVSEMKTQEEDICTENTQTTQAQISQLSTELLDKLNFLEVSMNMVTHFQRLLIEIQTRVSDWKAAALSSDHLLKKLSEAAGHMKRYEDNATPDNWSCHWDSTAKRYFYENKETKMVQWDYPESAMKSMLFSSVRTENSGKTEDDMDLKEMKLKKKRKVQEIKDTESKRSRSLSPSISSSEKVTKDYKNSATSGVATLGNPVTEKVPQMKDNFQFPGQNFPQFAGFPQNYGTYTNYHMMMRQMVYPPNGTPPPPSDASEAAPPPLPSEQPPPSPPPLPPGDVEGEAGEDPPDGANDHDDDGGIVMEMSEGEDEKDDQPAAIMSQNAILYKPLAVIQAHTAVLTPAMYSASHLTTQPTNQTILSRPELSNAPKPLKATGKAVKNKQIKKAKKAATGKKPPKEMTSLVAQWQKAKQQIEEEDRLLEEDMEDEMDRTELNKKEIEKWKQDQILSGKAMNNSNFEPVSNDWRARILKKKKEKR